MTDIDLPEGFKLLPNRGTHPERKKHNYGLSEKGEIFDCQTGKILVAPEGEDDITIRVESPGYMYESSFHIPTLLKRYFGKEI